MYNEVYDKKYRVEVGNLNVVLTTMDHVTSIEFSPINYTPVTRDELREIVKYIGHIKLLRVIEIKTFTTRKERLMFNEMVAELIKDDE